MSAREVYFVGTIPFDHAFEVFAALADSVGERARRVPDGEIGDRKFWVSSQYPVLASCPALEAAPYPAGGLTRQTSYELPLRLRKGARKADFVFAELRYARHAIASFRLFDAMQAAGRIPAQWRFQVNLPSPMDVMSMVEADARAATEEPYERALLGELDRRAARLAQDRR